MYVLTYLALQNKPVTAEDLGEAVWTGKANARRIATTAISMARKTLRDVDQELKNVITDGDGLLHEHTYLLSKRGAWDIQIDAERYLTPAFSAQNPDAQALWRMLEEFAPFLSRASESVFASDINGQLIQRVHAVASHLATRYAAREPRRAAYALLMALKTDFDPAAVDQLALVAQMLSERDRGIIATYLTLAAQEETMWDYLLREAHFALTRLSDGAALAF